MSWAWWDLALWQEPGTREEGVLGAALQAEEEPGKRQEEGRGSAVEKESKYRFVEIKATEGPKASALPVLITCKNRWSGVHALKCISATYNSGTQSTFTPPSLLACFLPADWKLSLNKSVLLQKSIYCPWTCGMFTLCLLGITRTTLLRL